MNFKTNFSLGCLLLALAGAQVTPAATINLTNPIVFVTQPPITKELNSSVSNTFFSVVSIFGNHLPDTAHAARGGDLWLMTTNGGLVNLTRKAGFGVTGVQGTNGIAVRDPAVHWGGGKILFSMVVGGPANAADTNVFFWQLYELTNLSAVIANTNTVPLIVKVASQATNYNNVSPCYATDGRIIFTSDRPINGQALLYPQRDEYKGAPTVVGAYSLDPVSGDLRLLNHAPSGLFNPFIDSFGRLIVTRWDHLVQDGNATDDRLGLSTNGAFNFLSENSNSPTQPPVLETFPEPTDNDTAYSAQLGVNADGFNFLFPWALDQDGGNEEVLNHVGRHELATGLLPSFTNDVNLIALTNPVNRAAFGVESADTNFFNSSFLQITEDPRTNGLYWGVDAPDLSPYGGTHASGQILTLTGAFGQNPTNMVITYITARKGATTPASGIYRNPLPMSDGTVVAVYSTSLNTDFGYDTNLGTASLPVALYNFRLRTLTNPSGTNGGWTTNLFLTSGLTNVAIYWAGGILVTNAGPLWELEPVEVRARPIPTPVNTPVMAIEAQVFADEGVDLPTFQSDLAQRGAALVVSRNVTARDAADKQQPYNLNVPGGVQTLGTNTGKIYNITHLQYLQADFLRGYTVGTTNPLPGRRVLATPLHATTSLNYASSLSNAPLGGTQIMSDGSQATIIPAGRAMTWQFTGVTNESIVKERYWITFRPGEVRTCANCHGINDKDQAGRPSPTNAPFALRQLLRLWRTNSANAYTLTVSNTAGSGSFGAGTVLTLNANPAPSGKIFSQWLGAGVSNAASPSTLFIMPTNNTVVTAVYSNLPPPAFTGSLAFSGTNLQLTCQALVNQSWILQSSADLVTWTSLSTNLSTNGVLQYSLPVATGTHQQFYRLRSP